MSRRGENIFKRKDGRWEARYVKEYDSAGKKKYGYCYARTYREAKEKVDILKISRNLVVNPYAPIDVNNKNISQFCDEWLNLQKNRLKESTFVRYNMIFTNHIKPYFGSLCPLSLNDGMIGIFSYNLIHEKKLSPKTVRDILGLFRTMINYITPKYPGIFPALHIIYPKENLKEVRVLTREEQTRLFMYMTNDMDECKFGVLLAALTGMRIGELCALQWRDIILSEQIVKVIKTIQRIKDSDKNTEKKTKIVIDTPKSERSVRTIPLTNYAAKLCQTMNPESPETYILTGNYQYMEPRTLQYRFKKFMEECGLEAVHFHTLRHTFATRCVEVGFDIKSLSEILGHANTTVTLERYVHSTLPLKRDNMKKLESIGF